MRHTGGRRTGGDRRPRLPGTIDHERGKDAAGLATPELMMMKRAFEMGRRPVVNPLAIKEEKLFFLERIASIINVKFDRAA